jgi:hypothetical protein
MRFRYQIEVGEEERKRLKVAKYVLRMKSYNEVLDYFLKAFEKQFAADIEYAKSQWKKPEMPKEENS